MENENLNIERVDIANEEHCNALLKLLDDYMQDKMGCGKPMSKDLGPRIISGIKSHSAYLGIFAKVGSEYAGLANCNIVFSTWKAKPIINIHDFIVAPEHRNKGVGEFLMQGVFEAANELNSCRVSLEVRDDNQVAQRLYKRCGFEEATPPMLFWEKNL